MRLPWRIDPLFYWKMRQRVLYASKHPSAYQMTTVCVRLTVSSREFWVGVLKSVRCGWGGTRVNWVINLVPCVGLHVTIERPSRVQQRDEYLAELRKEKL